MVRGQQWRTFGVILGRNVVPWVSFNAASERLALNCAARCAASSYKRLLASYSAALLSRTLLISCERLFNRGAKVQSGSKDRASRRAARDFCASARSYSVANTSFPVAASSSRALSMRFNDGARMRVGLKVLLDSISSRSRSMFCCFRCCAKALR